jgi:hypothetical protein
LSKFYQEFRLHDEPTCKEIKCEGAEVHELEVLEWEMYVRERTTRVKVTDMSQRGLIGIATRQTHVGSSMVIHIGYTNMKDSSMGLRMKSTSPIGLNTNLNTAGTGMGCLSVENLIIRT